MRDPSELERHDREAGRQLLIVSLPIGLLVVVACFAPSPTMIGAAIFGVVVNVLCFVNPVAAIRLASGRFSELLPRPEPSRASEASEEDETDDEDEDDADEGDDEEPSRAKRDALAPVRTILQAQQEGTPLEVALLERELTLRKRRWIGIGLMVVGTGGCVLGMALGPDASSHLWKLPGGLAFAGLVLWYRTL